MQSKSKKTRDPTMIGKYFIYTVDKCSISSIHFIHGVHYKAFSSAATVKIPLKEECK